MNHTYQQNNSNNNEFDQPYVENNQIAGDEQYNVSLYGTTAHAAAASAEGQPLKNTNFFENNQDYDDYNAQNSERQNNQQYYSQEDNEHKEDENTSQNMKFEDQEEDFNEEFHSFTIERDVDPDELKDPDNYYEQLSMSFYNSHKKGDQVTRKLIEQSLQAYLENKRQERERQNINRGQHIQFKNHSPSAAGQEDQRNHVKLRVKIVNYDTQNNQRKNFIYQQPKNNSQQELEMDKQPQPNSKGIKIVSQRSYNMEKETTRVIHHNQFQVTNSNRGHRYFIKEKPEQDSGNNQQISLSQLLNASKQPLAYCANQNQELSKYTPASKLIDMDAGFKGNLRNNNSGTIKDLLSQNIDDQMPKRHSNGNKNINLLHHIQNKTQWIEAAPVSNIENLSNYAEIAKTESNTPTPRKLNEETAFSQRNHNGKLLNQASKFNQNLLTNQQNKKVFPSIKLEDEHQRYINSNDNLQVQGKNQIKLTKQNDFFEFAAQLYNTNKSGNPQQIPIQLMKKLKSNDNMFSTDQLQRISNQLQKKVLPLINPDASNGQRQQFNYQQTFKKEAISLTSR